MRQPSNTSWPNTDTCGETLETKLSALKLQQVVEHEKDQEHHHLENILKELRALLRHLEWGSELREGRRPKSELARRKPLPTTQGEAEEAEQGGARRPRHRAEILKQLEPWPLRRCGTQPLR